MGNTNKIVNTLIVTVSILLGFYFYWIMDTGLPDYYRWGDYYWGSKEVKEGERPPKDDPTIKKFTVNIPDSVLTDLKDRLKRTRYPPPSIPGTAFEYGFNAKALPKVIEYWSSKYDWRKHEKEMNKYPHFKTQVEGLDIHFIHVKPTKPAKEVKAILLIHGWGTSFYEFLQVIPHLIEPSEDGVAFEVVVPSLPGFAWSEASYKPGLDVIHLARVFSKLMTRLGYEHYLVHGGDWGSPIGKVSAILYPDRIIGFHTTLPTAKITLYTLAKVVFGYFIPSHVYDNSKVDIDKVHPIMEKVRFLFRESGYFHLQATKPDTIGIALGDSPAGLAAYFLDRFAIFTDPKNIDKEDGGLTEKFTMDQLITNIMIYWVTNTAGTSARIYKESAKYVVFNELNFEKLVVREWTPSGLAVAPNEIMRYPKALLREVYYNISHYTDFPRGGHFLALEEPKLLADDLRKFNHAIKTKRLY